MTHRLVETDIMYPLRSNDRITYHETITGKYILDQGFGAYDKQLIVRYLSSTNFTESVKVFFNDETMSDMLYKALMFDNINIQELIDKHTLVDMNNNKCAPLYIHVHSNNADNDFSETKRYLNNVMFNYRNNLVVKEMYGMKIRINHFVEVTPHNIHVM